MVNPAVVKAVTATPTEANHAVKITNQARVRAKATMAARNRLAATATKAAATAAERRNESFFF